MDNLNHHISAAIWVRHHLLFLLQGFLLLGLLYSLTNSVSSGGQNRPYGQLLPSGRQRSSSQETAGQSRSDFEHQTGELISAVPISYILSRPEGEKPHRLSGSQLRDSVEPNVRKRNTRLPSTSRLGENYSGKVRKPREPHLERPIKGSTARRRRP